MRNTSDHDSEPLPSDSPVRGAWLESDNSSPESSDGMLMRGTSLLAGIWLFAQLLIIYVVVPLAFVVMLAVLLLVIRVHPLIGGIMFALGVGLGVSFYLDEIVR